jgi:hypothetical protein
VLLCVVVVRRVGGWFRGGLRVVGGIVAFTAAFPAHVVPCDGFGNDRGDKLVRVGDVNPVFAVDRDKKIDEVTLDQVRSRMGGRTMAKGKGTLHTEVAQRFVWLILQLFHTVEKAGRQVFRCLKRLPWFITVPTTSSARPVSMVISFVTSTPSVER